jgi:hypothetical protein
MKIIFHDNSLSMFGTSVALFDYAFFCKHLFGFDVSIMYANYGWANNELAIKKFTDEFEIVQSYNSIEDMNCKIESLKADVFFMIGTGRPDDVFSRSSQNWINAIGVCDSSFIRGEKFYMGSKWLSEVSGIDYVPYMVNLPQVNDDMRDELGIPKDAIVFGRNGGKDSFDIEFAKKAVIDSVNKKENIFFLFQGTDKFFDHPRIIHLPQSSDLKEKARFINTTDALLHARHLGESFGQTCAEFSTKNKPVITWIGSPEKNHIMVLGDKGIYYNDYQQLLSILLTFEPNDSIDWNCYREYTPEIVMDRFKKLYLDQ